MALTIPTRTLVLDGQPVTLRGDFAAIYALEEVAGKSVFEVVSDYQARRDYRMIGKLLFAFSQGGAVVEGDLDPAAAFKAWLKTHPPIAVDDFTRVASITFNLLIEALTGGPKNESTPAEEPAQDPSAADSPESPTPSTGAGSTTASPSSGDAPV